MAATTPTTTTQFDANGTPRRVTTEPSTSNCKHCDGPIHRSAKAGGDWVHSDGVQGGRHTCPVDPYGFHAEPVGTPCGNHPANPCNGARGSDEPTSDCPDCAALMKGYGAPDRRCATHWQQDNPGGIRFTIEVTDVNPDLWARLFGTDTPPSNPQTTQKPAIDVRASAVGGGADG